MTIEKRTRQELENILNRVGLPHFYMSVAHLFDVGYRNITEETVKEATEEIQKEEDPPHAIMTNDFKIFLLETAFEISKVASPLELARFVGGK